MTCKQKIGWGLVVSAFALTVAIVRYANLYWLEVLALPIMGLVGLSLTWGMNDWIEVDGSQ
jgi:hypothetical protein